MRNPQNPLLAALVAGSILASVGLLKANPDNWPVITREQRPWAYWWWMGSAVDRANITKELQRYRDAGYGGVHIIPIYGAKGWETNYIRYLSPQWMEMLNHTVAEANRLDLGVDMTTGTGWCFGGGPNVTEAEGNANVVVKTFDVAEGKPLAEKVDAKQTHTLMAFSPEGKAVDLTKKIRADGSVDWTAKNGDWKLYAVSQKFSGQKVKRPALGGEGPMLNLLYPDAMKKFLSPFEQAFEKYEGAKPRAQYHDSYEYKSEWSPVFLAEFEKRRGYKLQNELPALFSRDSRNTQPATRDADRAARVLCDYRETASDIMVEDSLPQWVKWSHDRGFITRNEAHGSPGNLLDLYALADVPETEMFRLDRNKLVSKVASSAAHVAGRKFVSCETGTWLKEHFTETLADMKWLADDLFLSGVNHIFYHGTCYSPDEAGWPGWVFYASYEMNPRNAVWRDARALNDYIARCQSILQSGKPDSDILVYWPIHDFWQRAGSNPLLPHLTVHARGWFEGQPLGKLAEQLWKRGYQFDYASDRQLASAKAVKGEVQVTGGNYRAVVVPVCNVMPLETLEKLSALSKAGVTVIFEDQLPKDVPGWGDLEKRRKKLAWMRTTLSERARVGEVESLLAKAGIARESMVDHAGLFCIRRLSDTGRSYFIANRSEKAVDGWVPLATEAKSALVMEPLSGKVGVASVQKKGTATEVRLQLAPGESVIVKTLPSETGNGPAWRYAQTTTSPVDVQALWRVEFLSGGPGLPATFSANQLFSWTESADEAAKAFSGTARYAGEFNAPQSVKSATGVLDLGKVVQSARVRLNGKDYGTLITPPYRVVVDNLKPSGNQIDIEVTSTSANRIRDLDRRGVKWKNFSDINFVNQDYKAFDASNWPVAEAGLLGPVTLTALKEATP